jgi:hypothetical protein
VLQWHEEEARKCISHKLPSMLTPASECLHISAGQSLAKFYQRCDQHSAQAQREDSRMNSDSTATFASSGHLGDRDDFVLVNCLLGLQARASSWGAFQLPVAMLHLMLTTCTFVCVLAGGMLLDALMANRCLASSVCAITTSKEGMAQHQLLLQAG